MGDLDGFQGCPKTQMYSHWRQFQQAHPKLDGAVGARWFSPSIYSAIQLKDGRSWRSQEQWGHAGGTSLAFSTSQTMMVAEFSFDPAPLTPPCPALPCPARAPVPGTARPERERPRPEPPSAHGAALWPQRRIAPAAHGTRPGAAGRLWATAVPNYVNCTAFFFFFFSLLHKPLGFCLQGINKEGLVTFICVFLSLYRITVMCN